MIAELSLYQEAGISPKDILKIATIGSAKRMKMDGDLGTIEPGKIADLLLVDGDPTQDINDLRKLRLVIKDGIPYYPDDIYRALNMNPCCD